MRRVVQSFGRERWEKRSAEVRLMRQEAAVEPPRAAPTITDGAERELLVSIKECWLQCKSREAVWRV